MYTLTDYGRMICDKVRMNAYAAALKRHVFPGCVVADLGAGPGIFSLLACQFGAARVYAIDPDSSIDVARECAAANGFADRITCIRKLSTEVELPERVDVIVSDMRGMLPLLDQHFEAIADARRRLLKPGGVLIPLRDTIYCAPVEAQKDHAARSEPWARNDYGLDLSCVSRYMMKSWDLGHLAAEQFLAPPADWTTIDYTSVTTSNLDGEMEWSVERGGTLHGLAIWFDAELSDDIGYSNMPGKPRLVYGHCFIPLAAPVDVLAGDRIWVRLRTNKVLDGHVYRWDTRVSDAGGRAKAEFRQSSIGDGPVSQAALRKRVAGFVPRLGDRGQIERVVLNLMDQGRDLREISEQLAQQFSDRFPDARRALGAVAELSVRYSD